MALTKRLWGVAVSHYQIEGGDECDWTEWERAGRTRGEPCGRAVDSWHRYETDADLAKAAGANAFRFSVSWSRIEPERGRWNDDALARYSQLVDHLVRIGVEPCVTLFHYTHPRWFHHETPWTSTRSIDAFALFARRVAEVLGDRVRFWVPLNEPLVFALAGFYDGQIPPGIADAYALNRVIEHLLIAHAAAAHAIRESCPDATIGVAHNMMAFAPERRHSILDRVIAGIAHRTYNHGLLEAFATGRWDFLLPPFTRIRGRRDDLRQSLDVFGVNFYSRLHLRTPGAERGVGDFRYRDTSGHGLTDNGWEIVPHALEELVREAARGGFPIVITENGLADADDTRRAHFIKSHAFAIERVERRGIPIDAYFHWSLVDNYEWLDGFGPKFGLYAVDRATMQRTARPSVEVFREAGARYLRRWS